VYSSSDMIGLSTLRKHVSHWFSWVGNLVREVATVFAFSRRSDRRCCSFGMRVTLFEVSCKLESSLFPLAIMLVSPDSAWRAARHHDGARCWIFWIRGGPIARPLFSLVTHLFRSCVPTMRTAINRGFVLP